MRLFESTWDGRATAWMPTLSDESFGRNFGRPDKAVQRPNGADALIVKVHPGKGAEYRRLWDRYNKPVYEQLVADGVVLAWGLAVEDIKTAGEYTHYIWTATADMAAFDKVRAAFNADRDKRSQEERDLISASFSALLDADASRTLVTRSIVFKLPAPKSAGPGSVHLTPGGRTSREHGVPPVAPDSHGIP